MSKDDDLGMEPDWPAIERAYEADDMTVDAICDGFNIRKTRLYRYLNSHGIPRRSDRAAKRTGSYRIARLYAALDSQMADVERRLSETAGESGASEAGDRERDARTLATLARTLEKLNAMAPETDLAEGEADDSAPDNIEDFRRELSRRLAELRRQGSD